MFNMDDLKLYVKNDEELEGLLSTLKIFRDDIGLQFSLDKSAKATFIRRRWTSASEIKLNGSTSIRELDQEVTYRYLE